MPHESPAAQKSRSGFSRLLHAGSYSLAGLKAGWNEAAFRQEVLLGMVMIPAAFWVGRHWLEVSMLIVTIVLVMITELLNTAVEKTIDRIGPEWHALSKLAKDLGSAAVLLALLLCGGVWLAALYSRLF
jgi:diacylglycerol kinase (ATP)